MWLNINYLFLFSALQIILVDGYFIHIIMFSQENTSKLNMCTSVICDAITEEICYNYHYYKDHPVILS